MREITNKMRIAAKKYITPRWREKYGFLEPYDIDEEKIQETSSGVYLKCICHFPDCPTMAGKVDPDRPWASVRGSKLNGRTQISCGACAKKARQLDEFKFKEMKVGDTIGCWHLDEEFKNKDLKDKMGWTNHSKYFKAHCIYCGITDYKNADHLKVGDDSCVCKSGSANEKRLNRLLKRLFENNDNYFYMSEYALKEQRVDFTILNKNEEPVLFIEYDGEFHDKDEMTKGALAQSKELDKRKNLRAEELGIPIIRINYKEQMHITEPWLKEHIEEYLGNIWGETNV